MSTECAPGDASVAVRPVERFRSVIRVGPVSVKRPTVGAAASTGPIAVAVTSSGKPQSRASTPWNAGVAASADPAASARIAASATFTNEAICEMTVDR